MSKHLDFHALAESLKTILKARKITYKELAKLTNIPESTLKKNLTSDDCSFNRLTEICSAIDLSMEDLLMVSKTENPNQVYFSREQAEYFLADMDCFKFYWHLVYERKSVSEITDLYSLSKRQTIKFLSKLDRLNLIEMHANEQIKIPRLRPVQWIRKDPFTDKLFREWSTTLLREAIHARNDDSCHMRLQMYQLRPDSVMDLIHALKDVDDEFSRRSIREMSVTKHGVVPVRVSIIAAKGSFVPIPTAPHPSLR